MWAASHENNLISLTENNTEQDWKDAHCRPLFIPQLTGKHRTTRVKQWCYEHIILTGRKDVNIDEVLALLDHDADVVREVVHEPSASFAVQILLESGGVDLRRHVVELEVEAHVTAFVQLGGFLKAGSLKPCSCCRSSGVGKPRVLKNSRGRQWDVWLKP